MKNRLYFLAIVLLMAAGCGDRSETPFSPSPPPPQLTEILVGRVFFHDLGPGNQYDIFMADLYLVPKVTTPPPTRVAVSFPGLVQNRIAMKRGVQKFPCIDIGGEVKEHPVVKAILPIDIDLSLYDFVLKNMENLTQPTSDDWVVAVSEADWIAWVKDPNGRFIDGYNTQIFYMNLADRIEHQLTPINGQYDGDNFDPAWKGDHAIAWVHSNRIVEVDLYNLNGITNVLPDWSGPQYDPVYSPDGSMLLFNTWIKGKKNSFIKHLRTGVYASVLPQSYFAAYTDDNPSWIFSNTWITGHIFMPRKGRIYTRELPEGPFSVITDGQQDFRYVTPVRLRNLICFVFADWGDPERPKLWICDETGGHLRELNQTGDEPVFAMLGLPVPQSKEDLERLAVDYSLKFNH
jgi:hypothetical protein